MLTLKELIDQQHPFSVPIVACKFMEGGKIAVWQGGRLYVSEAMKTLLKDEDSIEQVAGKIEVLALKMPECFEEMPMVIPEWSEFPRVIFR